MAVVDVARGAELGRRRRLIEHVRIPLHRDAYALTVNAAFTAATGFVYWIVAAKQYSPHAVGMNSALISSMIFLAGIAGLNLPNLVVRFLPEAGDRTARAVAASYAAAALDGALAVGVFVVGIEVWAPSLDFLHTDHALLAWFLVSTLAWCVFTIQDSVLTALGRAVWVPMENAVFSVLKLGLLVAVAALVPVYGIFVSWTVAMLVSIAGVNVLIFRRLMDARRSRAAAVNVRDRDFARYFAADYLCSIGWVSAVNLMPIFVTAVAGATTNAYYALAWAVALPLYVVSANVGMSLVLHGTQNRAQLSVLTRRAAIQGARLLVPATAFVVLLAPMLLRLFGAAYAEHSATLLRLLAAGALPNLAIILVVSVARVERRMRVAVVGLVGQAVLALTLVTPLLHAFGVTGAGVAWLAGQSVAAAAVLFLRSRSAAAEPAPPVTPAVRVLEVDLAEPLPTVEPVVDGRSYGAAQVLVRLRRRPVGIVRLELDGRSVGPHELERQMRHQLGPALREHLAGAARARPAAPAARPSTSVIIATCRRPAMLRKCLDALLAGDTVPDEIVVVDNAPGDSCTADLLRDRYADRRGIRWIGERRPGAARARATGLAVAFGEVVAFLDDDVVVDRAWMAAVADAFAADSRVAAVTGPIVPLELETPAQIWLEQFGGFTKGFRRRVYDLDENRSAERLYPYSAGIYGSGASMAFRAGALRALGGMDPRLSFGGEDLDLFLKVILGGHRLVYEPEAIAWHHHPSEYRSLRRTMFHYGAGLTALMTKWAVTSPAVAWDIGRRLPAALRLALDPRSRKNENKRSDYPGALTRVERVGMLAGPLMFAHSSWRLRRER